MHFVDDSHFDYINRDTTIITARLDLALSDLSHLERRRQGLLELVSLVAVLDAQGVQVPGAPDLELGGTVARLLDLHGAGVLAARREQELLDLFDSLRLRRRFCVRSARGQSKQMEGRGNGEVERRRIRLPAKRVNSIRHGISIDGTWASPRTTTKRSLREILEKPQHDELPWSTVSRLSRAVISFVKNEIGVSTTSNRAETDQTRRGTGIKDRAVALNSSPQSRPWTRGKDRTYHRAV